MQDLPSEVICAIFAFVDAAPDYAAVCAVSRRFYELIRYVLPYAESHFAEHDMVALMTGSRMPANKVVFFTIMFRRNAKFRQKYRKLLSAWRPLDDEQTYPTTHIYDSCRTNAEAMLCWRVIKEHPRLISALVEDYEKCKKLLR